MHIGEVFQFRTRAPVGQPIDGQMDHHRAGRVREGLQAIIITCVCGLPRELQKSFWRDIGNHGIARHDLAPIGEFDAFRLTIFDKNARDFGIESDASAPRLKHGHHRIDGCTGAPLAQNHAECLVGHAFQIRKQRAAGDVRGEIQMHAPRTEKGAHFR